MRAGGTIDEARLLAGRALAWEGIDEWGRALGDYDRALQLATASGRKPDPYVVNSRGNVRASLGDWAGALPARHLPLAPPLAAGVRWRTCVRPAPPLRDYPEGAYEARHPATASSSDECSHHQRFSPFN